MDVKAYYRRIREIEASLPGEDVLVVSLATPDGGREGLRVEVSPFEAARLVVEDRARLATKEEAAAWKEEQRALLQARQKAEIRQRVQVHVMSEEDLQTLKTASRSGKKSREGDN